MKTTMQIPKELRGSLGLTPKGGVYRETTPFQTLGVMLDCSRNAVMTVETRCPPA